MSLHSAGFQADVATTAAQAKLLLTQNAYHAMTLDLILPDQDGVSLFREIRGKEMAGDE